MDEGRERKGLKWHDPSWKWSLDIRSELLSVTWMLFMVVYVEGAFQYLHITFRREYTDE